MSDEIFDFLDKQKKETGVAYWACKPCTKYAQGMNHRMREIEEDLKVVKQNTKSNTEVIEKIEKKVDELVEVVKKNENITKEDMEAMLRAEREETRERKDRELNAVLHGAEECGTEVEGGEARMAWDKEQCLKLFTRQNMRMRPEDIRFCRRVGPKGEKPRPLIIGFSSHATRNAALRTDLKTIAPYLSLGPDLTKKQREEAQRYGRSWKREIKTEQLMREQKTWYGGW
jgi:hypothetical protein